MTRTQMQEIADRIANDACVGAVARHGVAQAELLMVVCLIAYAKQLSSLRGPKTAADRLNILADQIETGTCA
jgi:hypothetical protein